MSWIRDLMERFFKRLKTERLNQLSFINHAAAVKTVESYIYFYTLKVHQGNYKRLQSSFGYLTQVQKTAT